MKKNYQTSEFWLTIAAVIVSFLYLFGIITDPDDKDKMIDGISTGIEGIFILLGQMAVLLRYIRVRGEEKKAAKDAEIAKEISKQVELALEKERLRYDHARDDEQRTEKCSSED